MINCAYASSHGARLHSGCSPLSIFHEKNYTRSFLATTPIILKNNGNLNRKFSSSSGSQENLEDSNLLDHKDPILSNDLIYFFAQFIGMGIGIYIGRNISKHFFDPSRY